MRFQRLEVRNFRAIEHAAVEFGPGLNVLYGPNDLGKTTLASALRAALLLPADSTAHREFVAWQGSDPPRVSLTFENDGTRYRLHKTFGAGSAASSLLESSRDGAPFQEQARWRAVDRCLRELLGWGIEAPGGKGGSRGLPESFLSHVLLGAQESVLEVLARSLDGDRDSSGRERLHQALQALAQDPVFKRVLDTAMAKVDSAYTPTGKRKMTQDSPFAPVRQRINVLLEDVERYSKQRRETEEVLLRIAGAHEQRAEAERRRAELERRLSEQRSALARHREREALLERAQSAARELAEFEAAAQQLADLERALTRALEEERAAQLNVAAADAALGRAEQELARADAELLDQTSESRAAQGALGRAALRSELLELEQRLARDGALLDATRALSNQHAAWVAERQALEQALTEESQARQRLSAAEAALTAIHRVQQLGQLREAELALARAEKARTEAELLLQRSELARAAAQEAAVPELPAGLTPDALRAARELEEQMRLAEARLSVGLSLAIRAPKGTPAQFSADGARSRAWLAGSDEEEITAKSRLDLKLPGDVAISARAGDPSARERLAELERRREREIAPLLAATQVTSLAELATWLERRQIDIEAARARRREAEALAESAAEKLEQAADLEQCRARVEERAKVLAGVAERDRQSAAQELAALGAGWEATLRARAAVAERELASARQALEARAAAQVRLVTRTASLEESVQASRAARDRLLSEQGAALSEAPELNALSRRVVEQQQAAARVKQNLEQLEQRLLAEERTARDRRQAAMAACDAALRSQSAARAAHESVREQRLSLSVQHAERKRQLEALDVSSARAELEQIQAELARFGPAPPIAEDMIAASEAELARAIDDLKRISAELARAEGALGQVGGDVAVERERDAREALERMRAHEQDLECEYAAYQLLAQTLRQVENEQGVHLGRALETPVSERFERLTAGRYAGVALDRQLGLVGVFAAGQPRGFKELSMGTREQLATILRLCLAEQLDSALVLDDHLAQTHRERIAWFREALADSARKIQIIVLTARPEDYLEPQLSIEHGIGAPRTVSIDLEQVIRRAAR